MSRTMKKEGEDFSNSPSGEEVEGGIREFWGVLVGGTKPVSINWLLLFSAVAVETWFNPDA